jgi:Tol biopolymer transport system component
MRRASLLFLALAAANLAATTPASAKVGVTPWKPAGISSPQWESHPAFDPVNGDLYFVRSSPAFEGWHLLVSRCTAAGWSNPEPPSFASDAIEADPWFTPDGGTLYFISTRAFDGKKGKDLDIWRVDRKADHSWSAPERLPEPVNSSETEWFPRLAPDGYLYFGSKRPGGLGGNDIWRARGDAAGHWSAENLGPAINTPGDEYEPLPSADGKSLTVATADGFFVTHQTSTGWSARQKLGPDINANGTEIGPLLSPDGNSILFSRDTKGPDSGEFFVWHGGGAQSWPPDCPARAQ